MGIFGGNFLVGLAEVLDIILTLYFWILIISALISWVNPNPYNPIVRILRTLTEPVLYRVRKWFPFLRIGMVDLSPILVLLAIYLVKHVVVQSLRDYGLKMNATAAVGMG